jgi:hypothetical protein
MPESAELGAATANRFGPNSSRPTGSFRQGQNGKNEANTGGAKSEYQKGPNQVDKRKSRNGSPCG